MRRLTAKMTSRHNLRSEEMADPEKIRDDNGGKEIFESDARFDSGYSSGLVRDEFDSGTCVSSSESNIENEDAVSCPAKGSEPRDSLFDSGLGIDSTIDLDSQSKGEQLSPTCTSMTADLCWRDVIQQDQDGDSLLHLMIIKGIVDIIFSFINLLPRPEFLNVCNSLYQTPLHLAVATHQPRVVRRLVVARAAVDLRDHRGNTPLHLACLKGDLECVQALTVPAIAEEVDEALVRYPVELYRLPIKALQLRNFEGETCIHAAVRIGHLQILEFLFGCGADANTQDGKSGNTPLHLCVDLQRVQLVHFLLWQCRACTNVRNYSGLTALQMATDMYRHRPDQRLKAIISLLKRAGATSPEIIESEDESSGDSSEEDLDAKSNS